MLPKIFACITTRDGKPDSEVYRCLAATCRDAFTRGIATSDLAVTVDGYSVAACRNKAVSTMMRGTYTHLLFVDNDVLLQQDAIAELCKVDADIVAGCYPSTKSPAGTAMHVPYLTLQDMDERWIYRWFTDCRPVTVAGTGCMLIRRTVLESLGFPWFVWREELRDGHHHRISDDVDFCRRARSAGFSIVANGRVRCGHMKTIDVASMIVSEGEQRQPVTWTGPKTVADQTRWPDYGSHVPALASIGAAYEIRSAIEYGSGRYSTRALLNREWFPKLDSLVSYETDREWFVDTFRRNADSRLQLTYMPIGQLAEMSVPLADLVLIDCDCLYSDGQSDFTMRCNLIAKYERDEHAIVVVHDANFASLSPCIEQSRYRHKIVYHPALGPDTAVMSNSYKVDQLQWLDLPASLAG